MCRLNNNDKTIQNKIAFLLLATALFFQANAQVRKVELRGFARTSFPVASMHNQFSSGYQAGGSMHFIKSKKTNLFFSLEFNYFDTKKTGPDTTARITGISLGYRYKPSRHFYMQSGLGIALTNKVFLNKAGFMISPAVGYILPLGEGGDIDISASFNYMISRNNQFIWASAGLGVAYILRGKTLFNLKRKKV